MSNKICDLISSGGAPASPKADILLSPMEGLLARLSSSKDMLISLQRSRAFGPFTAIDAMRAEILSRDPRPATARKGRWGWRVVRHV